MSDKLDLGIEPMENLDAPLDISDPIWWIIIGGTLVIVAT